MTQEVRLVRRPRRNCWAMAGSHRDWHVEVGGGYVRFWRIKYGTEWSLQGAAANRVEYGRPVSMTGDEIVVTKVKKPEYERGVRS